LGKQTFSCSPAQDQRKQLQGDGQALRSLGMNAERLGKPLSKGFLLTLLILTAKATYP